MVRNLLFLALIVLLFSGCSFRPPVISDKTKLPEHYVYKIKSHGKFYADWWSSFHNKELNRLIDIAVRNNYGLKIALLRIKEAQLRYATSKTQLLPTVNSSFSYTRTRRKQNSFKTTTNSYNLSFYANYELDLWGSIRRGVTASLLEKRKAEYYYDSAMITLTANIVRNWLECIAINAKSEFLKKRVAVAKKRLEIAKASYRNGLISFTDYLSYSEALNKLETQLATLNYEYEIYLNQIKTLAGIPVEEKLSVKTTVLPSVARPLDIGLPSSLLENRPDVKSAFADLQEAFLNVKIAQANRLPQFSLSAELGYSTVKDSIMDLINNWFYSLAAKIAYVLVDFNRAKLQQEISEVEKSSAFVECRNTLLEAIEEVENAYLRLSSDMKDLKYLREMLHSQGVKVEIAKERFKEGSSSFSSYLASRDLLLSYESQMVDARKTYLEDMVNLYRAAGGSYYHEK